jgi:cation diffusion facilitator family transporter
VTDQERDNDKTSRGAYEPTGIISTNGSQSVGYEFNLAAPFVLMTDILFLVDLGRALLTERSIFSHCCSVEPEFDGMSAGFKRALWAVIGINAVMFAVEMSAGSLAGSQALQADALDFLADTTTYGISLLVIGHSLRVRAMAALLKGVSLGLMGLWVFSATAYQVLVLGVPDPEFMGAVGFLALLANLLSVLLLLRYKDGDANVRSVWLCSRNDAIGNVAVMLAAVGVWYLGSAWPDLVVAALMAGLFIWSSTQIIRQALREMREPAIASQSGD